MKCVLGTGGASHVQLCLLLFSSISTREGSEITYFHSFLFISLSILAFPHELNQLPLEFKDCTPQTTEITWASTKKDIFHK